MLLNKDKSACRTFRGKARSSQSQGAGPRSTKDLAYRTSYHYFRVWSRSPLSSSGLSKLLTISHKNPVPAILLFLLEQRSVMVAVQSPAFNAIFEPLWRAVSSQTWSPLPLICTPYLERRPAFKIWFILFWQDTYFSNPGLSSSRVVFSLLYRQQLAQRKRHVYRSANSEWDQLASSIYT